jgi:hypothetical protein
MKKILYISLIVSTGLFADVNLQQVKAEVQKEEVHIKTQKCKSVIHRRHRFKDWLFYSTDKKCEKDNNQ